jgi:hypothetical protein
LGECVVCVRVRRREWYRINRAKKARLAP